LTAAVPDPGTARGTVRAVERNILSIDVEECHRLNFASMQRHRGAALPPRVKESTERLLELLARAGARATFFFLGTVAERHPELVRAARDAGHEIGSHGHGHELVYSQDRAAFRADVGRSKELLEQIAGAPVRGYRAPSWSFSRQTPWAYEVLAELGFKYSSSVFPFRTYLYGDSAAPVGPHRVRAGDGELLEAPATVLELGRRRIPFGGGFYFRAMPLWLTLWAVRRVNRAGRPVVFYLHPREIDPGQPRLALPLRDRLVAYHGLAGTAGKLERLLARHPTATLWSFLSGEAGLESVR